MVTLDELGGWPSVLGPLAAGHDLTSVQAAAAMSEVLAGDASAAQIAALAIALRIKGETVEEMAGLVDAMLTFAERVPLSPELAERVIDTCGTGGDRSGSINVSTIAAFVAAGAGAAVCKHGNRAASSQAGSADLLEALGVVIDPGPDVVARCVDQAGMGFCFAARFHAALRHAGPVRRELGIATVFNFLGPLANPARLRRQVIGVSDPRMADKVVGVLEANGARHVLVVYGHDGLDELTTADTSTVIELVDGSVRTYVVDPVEFGFPRVERAALVGGDASTNADLARRVLDGERGPHRDIVVLNAAAALVAADIVDEIPAGVDQAAASIDSGAALHVLARLVAVSQGSSAGGTSPS